MDCKLNRNGTVLIVMDVQERLVAAMPDEDRSMAVDNVIRLVQGARILELPLIVTEQYPQGLGSTIPSVEAAVQESKSRATPIDKVEFDACRDPRFFDALATAARAHDSDGREPASVVLCGMETHICIFQTARAMLAHGYRVHVPHDATCCRRQADHAVAQRLLERMGAVVTSTETVLFDLLARAGDDDFKAINKLVR